MSFKESKADDLIAVESPNHLDFIRLTQKQLIRVYPGSIRQDSSNVHPLFYWTYGRICLFSIKRRKFSFRCTNGRT